MSNTTTNRWWARFHGVKIMGPYASQEAGWSAVIGMDGLPMPGAVVWFGPTPEDWEKELNRSNPVTKKEDCKGRAAARALGVIMLDPKLKAWLQAADPKAFEQAVKALEPFGYPGPMPALSKS